VKIFNFKAIFLLICLAATFVFASENTKTSRKKRAEQSVEISVKPIGPTQEMIDAATKRVERSKSVISELSGTKYRVISFEYIDSNEPMPTRFKVVLFDYTNNRTFVATSDFAATEPVNIRQEDFIPFISSEEIEEAMRIVSNNAEFADLIKSGKSKVFEPMPPITMADGERLVNIGITGETQNKIIGVSFKNNSLVRYENDAPPTSQSSPEACGIPNGGQGSTGRGVAGQYQMTISTASSGGEETIPLWEMLVNRPSSSSGGQGSGIDISNVKYRGKSVMKRGHAPVLNVQYVNNTCGPFLDWQYAEGFFDAPAAGATDPAPGIRILASGLKAKTALDSGVDFGNFQGVAIYTEGSETIMVTEMNAGWYRYIMEWRFDNNGTIRPRYGFGATDNSCVCTVHMHHVYWRFDFDIVNPNNNIFQVERGRKFLKPITNEVAIKRSYQLNRSLLIQNASGDEAYSITPSISDGVADTFGGGDFWVLKTAVNNGELGLTSGSAINMTPYLNNESVTNQDLTVWYATHFIHSDGSNLLNPDRSGLALSGSHVQGPNLRPVRW
jgi:hypothetical protein